MAVVVVVVVKTLVAVLMELVVVVLALLFGIHIALWYSLCSLHSWAGEVSRHYECILSQCRVCMYTFLESMSQKLKEFKTLQIVYDITRHDTFAHVSMWLAQFRELTHDHVPVILAGNKMDLRHVRDVTTAEGEALAGSLLTLQGFCVYCTSYGVCARFVLFCH